MKVFIVLVQDTNCVNTVEKVFLNGEDAVTYIKDREENRRDLCYYIKEYPVELIGAV